MTRVEVLSPHVDDAVFSCWYLINRPHTEVLTIFAGIPPSGTSTLWDRLCGESNSTDMMKKRRKENKTILSSTLASSKTLNFLDNQYKHPERDVEVIADTILLQTGPEAIFYAPLAGSWLRRHPDHVTLRKVGQCLSDRGREVSYYADIPYMQMSHNPGKLSLDKLSKRASKLLQTDVVAEIHYIGDKEQKRKRQAMLQYKTQYKITNLISGGMLGREANIKHELVFRLAK